jgi:hypothetical protein
MDTEMIGAFTETSSRRGVVWRLHRPPAPVSFLPFGGMAVFEGDIVLGSTTELEQRYREHAESFEEFETSISEAGAKIVNSAARIALGKIDPRWPSGQVPFVIDSELPMPIRVRDAIEQWEMHTRVRFPRRTAELDYVVFTRADGCGSAIGRQGGAQAVYVSDTATPGNIMHEIGHVLGLWHEQSRENRDEFIEIDFSNVIDEFRLNFDQKIADGDDFGAYDYDSIMHYSEKAFAKDPARRTIIVPEGHTIGQRQHLSAGDIAAIKSLYPQT